MKLLPIASIPADQIDQLENYALSSAGPELRDVLLSLSRCVREGVSICVIDGHPTPTLTPSEIAARLGMSRSHLYKLLDRGEIVSHRVGRDRRVRLDDLVAYEKQRQNARRQLAERFAHQGQARERATDEIADLL